MEVIEIPSTNCQQILDEIGADLRFIATSNTLKLYLADGLLGVEFKLFQVKNGEFRHYLVYELALETKLSIRHECNTKDPKFVKTSTFALLSHLQPTFEKFDVFVSVCTRDDIREAANEYFESINSHPFFGMDPPNWVFYFDNNQVERLMKITLELPKGYEFSKLRPEDAVEVQNDTLYTTKSDEKFIELKLTGLPSVSVVEKDTKALVSYVIHDNFGMLSSLYTRKRYRNQGIGSAVEMRFNQINFELLGIRPFKAVSTNRPRVIGMSAKAYSTFKDSEGKEEMYYWVYRSKYPKDPIEIYEN